MTMKRYLSNTLFSISILTGMLFVSCSYPPVPEDKDVVELERIWQYCKAFSLYSDRVPARERLLEFNNPCELVDSIYDTLYSHWDTVTYFWADYKPEYNQFYIPVRNIKDPGNEIQIDPYNRTVNFHKLTDSTAYIYIKKFGLTTCSEFMSYSSAIADIPNIIINLNKNVGGYVSPCLAVIDRLLPAGVTYLLVKERRIGSDTGTVDTTWTSAVNDSAWGGKKVVILIDDSTASASEILTVALRDGMPSGSVYIIGEKSFGKAIGQVIFHLLNDAGLRLTTLRFMPINGVNYHEVGITPDLQYSGSFRDEIITAGKWLEPGFETAVNTAVLSAIVATDSTQQASPVRGYYKIIEKDDLPF